MTGDTTRRGYGTPHQRLRLYWVKQIAAGGVVCASCGEPILPGQPFDLGHTEDRTGYVGPECRKCNRAKGARKTNAKRRQASQWVWRRW
jgi:hypothetical protein